MQRVDVFLGTTGALEALDASVRTEAARLIGALPEGSTVAWGRRIPDPAAHVLEARSLALDDSLTSYLGLEADDPAFRVVEEALRALGDRLGGTWSPHSTVLAAGSSHVVIEGRGLIALFHILRKRGDMSTATFHDYWSGGHTRFSATIPGLEGYVQHHVDESATARLAVASGLAGADFEGIAATYASSVDAHVAVMTRPQTGRGIADNDTFVDSARSPYLTLWELEFLT
jgi:hypothetical protein